MATVTLTGTYYHRTGWVASNWSRMLSAHNDSHPFPIDALEGLFQGTFNVQISGQDGFIEVEAGDGLIMLEDGSGYIMLEAGVTSVTAWIPPNDDDYRAIANAEGIARGSIFSDGSDFLAKGNYFNPNLKVTSINGIALNHTYLYYAGSDDPVTDPIDRHSLEIISTHNLADTLGVTAGDTITVVIDDGT